LVEIELVPVVPSKVALVWARAVPTPAKNKAMQSRFTIYFRRRIAPHAAIPTNSITPLEGSGTWVTMIAFT
jgi:hypothetical protein